MSAKTRASSPGAPGSVNRLRNIVPVMSVWTVNPPNPALATDDNWANSMGGGSSAMGGPGEFGRAFFDMGAIYNIELRAKFSIGNDNPAGGNMNLTIDASEDNITWFSWIGGVNFSTFNAYVANANQIGFFGPFLLRARYIRLHWATSVAIAHSAIGDIYEIQAIDDNL